MASPWKRPEWAPYSDMADSIVTLYDFCDQVYGHGRDAIPKDNAFLSQVINSPSAQIIFAIRIDQLFHCFIDGEVDTKFFQTVMLFLSYWFNAVQQTHGGWLAVCNLLGELQWFPSHYTDILRSYPGRKLLPNTFSASVVVDEVESNIQGGKGLFRIDPGDNGDNDDNEDDKKPSPSTALAGTRYFRTNGTETLEVHASSTGEAKDLMDKDHRDQMDRLLQARSNDDSRLEKERSNDDNRLDKERSNDNNRHQVAMAEMEKQSSLRQGEMEKQSSLRQVEMEKQSSLKKGEMEKQSSLRQEELKLQLQIAQVQAGQGAPANDTRANPVPSVTPSRKRKASPSPYKRLRIEDTPQKAARIVPKSARKTPRTKTKSRKLAAELGKIAMPEPGRDKYHTFDAVEGGPDFDVNAFANRMIPSCPRGKNLIRRATKKLAVDGGTYSYSQIVCGCAPPGEHPYNFKLRCVQVPWKPEQEKYIYALQRPETKPEFHCHVNEDGTRSEPVKGVDEDVF